tara:strand:+ start:769 stop:2055 length:1287 start_codon:yes stop_codon:yes gene_type:complete
MIKNTTNVVLLILHLLPFFVTSKQYKYNKEYDVMKKLILLTILCFISVSTLNAQTYLDSTINSSTKKIMFADQNFAIGSYGEAHYNHDIEDGTFQNGTMDLHRVILFMGYKFKKNLQFFTEIEFEHVKEVYVEQAFMNYSINSAFNIKAGIILIPMGYVNEFHEPTLFNGVERPGFDKYIIPSTWSEMGLGFHGILKKANLKYQIYAVNGFKGYDGSAKLSGSNGLRGGRQKGSKASFRTPSYTGKLTFYGLNGLRLGLSGYYGNTESTMYDGLDRTDPVSIQSADSSSVGIAMGALNAHYNIKNLQLTAVGSITSISNTDQYNDFTGATLGSTIMGYYGEVAYKIALKKNQTFPRLIPFVRYESYDTHFGVEDNISRNSAFNRQILTAGAGLQLTPGTIIKTDLQWVATEANPRPTNVFNLGFGYWF